MTSPTIVASSGFKNLQSAETVTYTTSWTVSPGNALICLIIWGDANNSTAGITGVADGQGSYTLDFNYNFATHWQLYSYSLFNCTSGAHTITFTSASAGSVWSYVVVEVAGLGLVNSFDSTSVGHNTSVGTVASAHSGTLSNASDILFAFTGGTSVGTNPSTPSAWTSLGSIVSTWPPGNFAYLVPGSTTQVNATFGAYSVSETWGAAIFGYKPGPVTGWPPTLDSATGVLSGIAPGNSEEDTVYITVMDTVGNTASQVFALSVSNVPPLTALWPDPLPGGYQGIPYSYTLTASGGILPYTFSIASGTLPAGLVLNPSTGVISGIPTVFASMDAVTFAVTDSA